MCREYLYHFIYSNYDAQGELVGSPAGHEVGADRLPLTVDVPQQG